MNFFTMKLPEPLIKSLETIASFNKEAFEKTHASGEQVTSIRINPSKQPEIQNPKSRIGWAESGFYLETRPSFTFDPLFHAGCYYVQEASSMFLEQALKQTVDLAKPLKVLDLCAAPGGKSTHLQSLISKDSLLVSNEVIRARAGILKDNIIKWGCRNVMVTNNDPKDFAKLENYFDVVIVDAPCSGSGLFRREPEAVEEWSLNNVQLCSQRQQRIIADVWPALKKDGILIYSTCSYSKEEDEMILDWIAKELPVISYHLNISSEWRIIETISDSGNFGYRFWPDKLKGEGFFLACFRKKDGEPGEQIRTKKKAEPVSKKELDILKSWINVPGFSFIKNQQTVYGWPEVHLDDFNFLLQQLKVVYSGVLVGELMRDKLVPDHALAMQPGSIVLAEKTELDREEAIFYLQKKEFNYPESKKGWRLASFSGHPLGWMNVLANRVNNYYPKGSRILKDQQ